MNNYRFKIEYTNDELIEKNIEISTFYQTYYQAYAFVIGYLLELGKEENVIEFKILLI